MIIAQNKIKDAINLMPVRLIKNLIGRQRLCFTKEDIVTYLNCLFYHQVKQLNLKEIHKEENKKNKNLPHYSAFMSNITLLSKLFHFIFASLVKKIKKVEYVIIDSTLIPEKQEKYITSKDYQKDRVTSRFKKTRSNVKIKDKTCGVKGLVFINEDKIILRADILPINYQDQNILKDASLYEGVIKDRILIADRGFSSKLTRKRVEYFNSTMISPCHYKQTIPFSKNESILYRKRWKIETLFQSLKDSFSKYKLNLRGKYSRRLKDAKFYLICFLYNLSITKE